MPSINGFHIEENYFCWKLLMKNDTHKFWMCTNVFLHKCWIVVKFSGFLIGLSQVISLVRLLISNNLTFQSANTLGPWIRTYLLWAVVHELMKWSCAGITLFSHQAMRTNLSPPLPPSLPPKRSAFLTFSAFSKHTFKSVRNINKQSPSFWRWERDPSNLCFDVRDMDPFGSCLDKKSDPSLGLF